ncbi:MAG: hypothetical protein AAF696_25165 [Bacteroidota bacterium]
MKTQKKTTPKVKYGKVQKKDRYSLTPNYWNTPQAYLQIDIRKPGKGYKHFLKKRDIHRFIDLLPDREVLMDEIDAIVLDCGGGPDGWYSGHVIGICAWEKDKTCYLGKDYFSEHKAIFERLNLSYKIGKKWVECNFTEDQIRAYQLLHIFLHELGHHHDRMNTKKKIDNAPRGEKYAEDYALKHEQLIWNRFFEEFNMT